MQIPEGWKINTVNDVSEFVRDGTHGTHKNQREGIPLLSAKDIREGKVYLDDNPRLISELEYRGIHKRYTIKQGDILLTIVGTIGRTALVKTTRKFTLQRSVAIIRPSSEMYGMYFLHSINSIQFQHYLSLNVNASAQGGIYLGALGKLTVILPPLDEQKKIADILTSVDDVIEKTAMQIAKLKDLKKAMMQELLTKGIGHTEFKDSPLGRIPASWIVKVLGQICEFTQGVQIPHSEQINEEKSGYIRYLYIRDFFSDKHKCFVKNIYPNKIMTQNDIMMVNTGHTAGNVYTGAFGVLSNNAFKTSFEPSIIDTSFLFKFLNSKKFKYRLNSQLNSAGQPHVGHKNIANIKLALPPLDEQKKIAEILISVDDKIEKTQLKHDKLQDQKKALMNDLLTGRVRV